MNEDGSEKTVSQMTVPELWRRLTYPLQELLQLISRLEGDIAEGTRLITKKYGADVYAALLQDAFTTTTNFWRTVTATYPANYATALQPKPGKNVPKPALPVPDTLVDAFKIANEGWDASKYTSFPFKKFNQALLSGMNDDSLAAACSAVTVFSKVIALNLIPQKANKIGTGAGQWDGEQEGHMNNKIINGVRPYGIYVLTLGEILKTASDLSDRLVVMSTPNEAVKEWMNDIQALMHAFKQFMFKSNENCTCQDKQFKTRYIARVCKVKVLPIHECTSPCKGLSPAVFSIICDTALKQAAGEFEVKPPPSKGKGLFWGGARARQHSRAASKPRARATEPRARASVTRISRAPKIPGARGAPRARGTGTGGARVAPRASGTVGSRRTGTGGARRAPRVSGTVGSRGTGTGGARRAPRVRPRVRPRGTGTQVKVSRRRETGAKVPERVRLGSGRRPKR